LDFTQDSRTPFDSIPKYLGSNPREMRGNVERERERERERGFGKNKGKWLKIHDSAHI
jgi:hypothetical protein